jgi:hypothetical protein
MEFIQIQDFTSEKKDEFKNSIIETSETSDTSSDSLISISSDSNQDT